MQQDRLARGLPAARVPGTLTVDTDSPTVPRPRGAAKAARKAAKPSARKAAKKTAKKK